VPTGISTLPAGAVAVLERDAVDEEVVDDAVDEGAVDEDDDGVDEDDVEEAVAGAGALGRGGSGAVADGDAEDDVEEEEDAGAIDSPRARERRLSMRSRRSPYSLRDSVPSLRSLTFR
jgi:hypothetical protein